MLKLGPPLLLPPNSDVPVRMPDAKAVSNRELPPYQGGDHQADPLLAHVELLRQLANGYPVGRLVN